MSELQFRLPDVGEGLDSAEIVEWRVEPGSVVTRDQPLVAIETDKALVEIPSPVNGTVLRLGGETGEILPVGAVLVVLETTESVPLRPPPDPPAQPEPAASAPADPAPADSVPADSVPAPAAGSGAARRVLASPSTRRLALELGVELADVTGSGPGGRVVAEDVRAYAASGPATEPAAVSARPAAGSTGDETVPLRGLRRTIARTMQAAWRDVPHITEFREVDATALVEARARLRPHLERDGVAFTYLPLLVKAVVATLAEHRKFNARIDVDAETITYLGHRNIGLATATDAGLMVPVLRDAATKSLGTLAREIGELAAAARDRSITAPQMSEGTFTVTNFGSFGGWLATPIIRPPEVAIAGFGRIRDAVVPVDGLPVVRPSLPVSVSADHRLIDGDDLGGFLATLTGYLTDPILLLKAD